MDLLQQSIKAEEKSRRERASLSSRTWHDGSSKKRNKQRIRSKSLNETSPLAALDERIKSRKTNVRTSFRPSSSNRTSVSNRLETTSEELMPSSHHSEDLSKSPNHRPSGRKSMELLDQSIKAEEKSRRKRASTSSSRTSSLHDDDLLKKRNKPKTRSKSLDHTSDLEALDERIKGRGTNSRTSSRPPSSDRDKRYAEKMLRGSMHSVDTFSDDDYSQDDGSLMDDILDQRANAGKGKGSRRRNKSNDRDRKRRASRSPKPSNHQSAPGAYSSDGTSPRRQHAKGDEGERAKLMAASLRSDGSSTAAATRRSRISALGSKLFGTHHAVDMSGQVSGDDDMSRSKRSRDGISMELEAHVVDEENPEVEAIKAENERIRRQMVEENQRLREEVTNQNDQIRRQMADISRGDIVVATANDDSDDSAAEDKRRKKRKRYIGLVIFCLVLLGAAAGGTVFAIQSNSNSSTVAATPSISPTVGPTSSPTLVSLYDKPNEEDCQAVENGELVDGQESMIDLSVVVGLEIVLNQDVERSEWLQELLERLTSYLVPYLVGCYDEGLPVTSNRYIFGNANATDYDDPETCERETELPCYAVAINLDLSLKDNAPIASLLTLLETLIGSDGSGNSLTVRLGLSENFNHVALEGVSQTPTASPTTISTNVPTSSQPQSPTISQTSSPSASGLSSPAPTWAPIQGPTSNAPTRPPTKPPTLKPTTTGTQSPTTTVLAPTQNPTKAPTQPPTSLQTPNPTLLPTRTPTATTSPPTPAPSSSPTPGLTPAPTLAQTPAPTSNPTPGPTPPPTPGPTPNPTPATPPPTPGPTPNPTPGPTPATLSFSPGDNCCSNNLKDCDVESAWCHENESQCTGNCNGHWLVLGSCPASGIVKDGECTNNVDDCCSPASCVTINEWYKQCQV